MADLPYVPVSEKGPFWKFGDIIAMKSGFESWGLGGGLEYFLTTTSATRRFLIASAAAMECTIELTNWRLTYSEGRQLLEARSAWIDIARAARKEMES